MQAINAAADHVLSLLRGGPPSVDPVGGATARQRRQQQRPSWNGSATVDHPSFTIEALPVDAFEALVIVASELGTLIDDDQPYRLEFTLDGDPRGMVRSDAGSRCRGDDCQRGGGGSARIPAPIGRASARPVGGWSQ